MNERMPTAQNEDADEESSAETKAPERAIGPLSDYFEEGGPTVYPSDPEAFLETLNAPRDPNAEVDVSLERERTGERLQQVSDLLEKEKTKEASLGAVRAELGIGESAVKEAAVEKLEQAKEKLLDEQRQIEHAEEYNDTLESLSKLPDEELQSVLDTGLHKSGARLRTKRGREFSTEEAKKLASFAKSGVKRVTWKMLNTMVQVADAVLHDLVSPWKKIIGLGG